MFKVTFETKVKKLIMKSYFKSVCNHFALHGIDNAGLSWHAAACWEVLQDMQGTINACGIPCLSPVANNVGNKA
eukprot:2442791-Amphidinium_carterae.1